MICLACTFERKGMQCKARRAAQGGPLSKRRNAAMRPFAWAAPLNPSGNFVNRSPALLRGPAIRILAVAPLRRVAAPSIRLVSNGAAADCVHAKQIINRL